MKKLFYYCLLLLPTLLIWQCKDDDYPPLPPVDTSLKFHVEDTLVMSTAGGSSTISLQSAKDWKLDVEYDATDPDKDWLSTDPTSGTASGTASVTVTTLASLVERKATLVLSQVGEDTEAPVRLVVRQDVDGFSVEKKNYPVGYEESVVHVKFLTNVTNYAAEVAEKDQKWIIPLPATMATTEGSLSFTIKKNTGPAARTGTITIYDADGNASSVDVTVTQEGAPVTGSMIYEGDNALDAVMMNVNGEYVSWVLRKDADEIVQGEANHISETGWWYATPPVSGSNIQYGGAAYGGVDYTFDQGPIAVRFPMPFPMTTLCFIGTNVKFSLYPWNTDYATTTAQTPVLEESFTSGEWQYPGGNPGGGATGRWDPSGDYLAVIESIGDGAMVGCNVVPNESHPEWSDMMSGYEMFLDGESSGQTGTLIGLSCMMDDVDHSQPFSIPGTSNLKRVFSSDGTTWNMTDEYYLNKAMVDETPIPGDFHSGKYGYADNVSAVKIGTKTFIALSDVNGKIWVASTTDGKDWAIVKEELSLTGSVSSMVVKDGTLNFYYAKDGALHLATASAADGWVDALTDAGQVLQLPDGVNNGTVVYNDVNNQFQFNYISADSEILSMVSDVANGSFEQGGMLLEGAGNGADKPFFVTDGEGHIGADAGIAYTFDSGVYMQM